YLGPSILQLVHLFVILVTNTFTLVALAILLLRTLWLFAQNITTIESWEIERHEVLVRRARANGGFLYAPDGSRVRLRKQEFPYDIGFFSNMRQAMGGSLNVSESGRAIDDG
ncbi:Palmitoyltransferase, partial [Ascosphaera acerosa]